MTKARDKINGYHTSEISYQKLYEPKHVSIIPLLWQCFGWSYVSATIFKAFVDIMMFGNPQVLKYVIF